MQTQGNLLTAFLTHMHSLHVHVYVNVSTICVNVLCDQSR